MLADDLDLEPVAPRGRPPDGGDGGDAHDVIALRISFSVALTDLRP
jgi:hypothetical protein